MAKRFTDTDKIKKQFWRELSLVGKIFWDYLTCDCDHAGIWEVDLGAASSRIGVQLDGESLLKEFGEKLVVLDGGSKWFCPSFIEFQYKLESIRDLNPENSVHSSILKRLSKLGVDPTNPSNTRPNKPHVGFDLAPCLGAKDKEEDKDKVRDEDRVKERDSVFEIKITPIIPTHEKKPPEEISAALPECISAWGKTLEKFKIKKDPALDQLHIARLIQLHGPQKARLALIGAGYESESKDFKPSNHCSITRLTAKGNLFEKFVNLGAQNSICTKEKTQDDFDAEQDRIEGQRALDEEFYKAIGSPMGATT